MSTSVFFVWCVRSKFHGSDKTRLNRPGEAGDCRHAWPVPNAYMHGRCLTRTCCWDRPRFARMYHLSICVHLTPSRPRFRFSSRIPIPISISQPPARVAELGATRAPKSKRGKAPRLPAPRCGLVALAPPKSSGVPPPPWTTTTTTTRTPTRRHRRPPGSGARAAAPPPRRPCRGGGP